MATRKTETAGIHVWLVLMKAYQALHQRAMRSIGNTSLCFSDFAALEALLHKGPMPVNTVGAIVALTSGSSTAAIDRLEKKDLVRRGPDANDRRTRIVHLTDNGRSMIEAAFRKHAADMEAVTAGLSSSEKKTLLDLLKKLGKNAVSGPATDLSSTKGQTNARKTH
jgi:MarR family transcriptional regulator, 2-MHQ and catechol-resistance regulon repressor